MKKEVKAIILGSLLTLIISLSMITGSKMQNNIVTNSNNGLSNKKIGWGIQRKDSHEQPNLGTKNTELIRAISSKISYNNDNNLELHERAYEESFLGYCLRNNYHLRLLNNVKDNIKYSMDTTKSIIKLYHNDNITFNLIK